MTDHLEMVYWPIDKPILYARNPRKNDAVIDRMISSIQEFGFQTPILAQSNGTVIDGHLRLKAARKMGLTEIPVVLADGLTEVQVKAFRLLANRSVQWADWDMELLALEFDDLKAEGFDLDLTGFDADELAGIDLNGEPGTEGEPGEPRQTMADRFGIPPFSVLNAREGWWQSRKQAWIAMGLQSELGRGMENTNMAHPETTSTIDFYAQKRKIESDLGRELTKDEAAQIIEDRGGLKNQRAFNKSRTGGVDMDKPGNQRKRAELLPQPNATPGGSLMPAMNYSAKQRGDGRGRPL